MRAVKLLSLALVLAVAVPAVAGAAVVQFTDRAMWLTAIGGTPDLEEDFSGFGVDTDFRPEPATVMTSMGTLGQVGVDELFRNFVDAAPFMFTDNNGTTHASCFVNFPEGGGPGTNVVITFDSPASAWGADFTGSLGGEFLNIDVIEDGTGNVLATLVPGAQDTFLGFTTDAGEMVGSVVLRSQNLNPGGAGKGFGMDNLAFVEGVPMDNEIPTVSQVGLLALMLLLALASLAMLRRRRAA